MMRKIIIKIPTQPVAYSPSTKNIATAEIIVPERAVCQLKK